MSERVRERLSGAQIDNQFTSISQGGYIRTTPTPSPRSSRTLGSYDTESRSTVSTNIATSESPASSHAGPVQHDEGMEGNSLTPTPQTPFKPPEATTKPKEGREATTTRPPPILKKLSSSSNRSSKNSSVLSSASQELLSTAGAGNEEAVACNDEPTATEPIVPVAGKPTRKTPTTRFNEEVAVSIPKVSTASRLSGGRLSGESSQRSGRRNPIVVAGIGASKRRPPVMRQRSSQAPSTGASKDAPSRCSSSPNLARSMTPTYTTTAESPSQEAEAETEAISTRRLYASSPHPSKRRKGSSSSPPSGEEVEEGFGDEDTGAQAPSTNPNPRPMLVQERANATELETLKTLVDPKFRSQFADKTRPSFAHKSSAAIPAAASFQASGTIDAGEDISTANRNKGKEAFKNEIVPLKAPASAGPEPPADAPQPLPRTKSQLTLLLQREKNRSLGQEH